MTRMSTDVCVHGLDEHQLGFSPGLPSRASSISDAVTLNEVVRLRAQRQAREPALLFMSSDGVSTWTYGELHAAAATIAVELRKLLVPGERVLLLFDPGLEYVAAFFGVLQAGLIAVPSFAPAGTRALQRIAAIIDDADPALVLSTTRQRSAEARIRSHCRRAARFEWLDTDTFSTTSETPIDIPVAPRELALLQYTSGSTGHPKGVMLTHANLVSDCVAMADWMGPVERWMGCTWLPPYHDMGLMGGILQPLYAGFPVVVMAPSFFVQSPVRWLRTLSDYRVTTTVSPNFALDLCTTAIEDSELEGIDLSSVSNIFCGAEPIRQSTFERFYQRFAPYGFRYQAFNPCYGMAETTLFVSGKPRATAPRHRHFDQRALDKHRVVETAADAESARTLTSCGVVADCHDLRIVDPATLEPCAADRIGEIWIAGPNVAQGYWQRETETQETFGAVLAHGATRYLRTGDLGFLHDSELYVTGRIKDVIIIAGRNHYPNDIELTAQEAHADIRANGVVAFGIDRDHAEVLVVVAEVRRASKRSPVDVEAVRNAILRTVTAAHGVRPDVHIGPIGTVPLTTSGKVQRRACKQAFLEGSLPALEPTTAKRKEGEHVCA